MPNAEVMKTLGVAHPFWHFIFAQLQRVSKSARAPAAHIRASLQSAAGQRWRVSVPDGCRALWLLLPSKFGDMHDTFVDLAAWEVLWTDFHYQWHAVLAHAKHVAASDFDAEAALAAPPDDAWLWHHCGK